MDSETECPLNFRGERPDGIEVADTEDVADADADLYGDANVMIPQPANVLNPSADPVDNVQTTLTIGYTMKQKTYAAITGTVNVPAPQAWEPGKRYLYTLCFKLNEILFNPTVTDWVDVNVATINILD